ncbi:MAG: isoleucine--tRNA ligase [Patescibacteria group bacterium]|jgi:isoleucyl-tRNA synthetase
MTNEKDKKASSNPFPKMEEEVLEFWNRAKIFEKSVAKPPLSPLLSEEGKNPPDYVFYDGPPFITGLPHYATLLPSIAKDVVPRYWTMKGYRVERVWGWDCHGLPAENKVEQELGLRNKKDIEKLGVDKFIAACRNYVNVGSEQWEWYINRIGRWVDMRNAYKTMDLSFMESVIWAFKKLYDDSLIYEGYRSSLHCPRCATPLSKFEITMDAGSYKDVREKSVVVKFRIKNYELRIKNLPKEKVNSDVYMLAWTTTPWTLPGNLALAVGEDVVYQVVAIGKEIYVLAKEKTEEIFKEKEYKLLSELKGKDLLGLEYEPLFDLGNEIIKENRNAFKIYAGGFVNTEEGTGIVHIAPNFGEDDFELGKKSGLPMVDLMDENGIYTKNAGDWAGQYFSKAGKKVFEDLGERLFSSFDYTHSYPFCYRCGTPLIYKAQKAWYLKISDIREKMIKTNEKINWVPEHFKEGRFRYNLESAPDWCLSRSRYWGSPIPVWKCTGNSKFQIPNSKNAEENKCKEIKVVGSIEELEKLSGKKITDLHKPGIDETEFPCDKCGGLMRRVPEVLDCWFESGAMPFGQFHYPFERKNEWKNLFPADFIIEYTGQLRGWFYYLHVLGNALFGDRAFKNVITTGVLAGTDGRKMSKSYGNYPDPKATLEKYGSDALRMYFMSSPIMLGDDMSLSETDLQTSLRKNVILLWNVYKFYEMFAGDGASPLPVPPPILRQLADQGEGVSKERKKNILDEWILTRLNQLTKEVTAALERYDLPSGARPITEFIDDLSTWYLRRSRDRFKSDDEKDKEAAIKTTAHVLSQLVKVMAPYMPFSAENIWQRITGNDFKDENKSVHLEAWPKLDNRQQITDNRILKDMETVRQIVELALAKRDEAGIKVRQPLNELKIKNYELRIDNEFVELIKDEVNVKNVIVSSGKGNMEVELDTKITPELKQEGVKREIVRLVNGMRKDAGLTIKDRIEIYYATADEEIKKAISNYRDSIIKDTLADALAEGGSEAILAEKNVKVEGQELWLGIVKK